MKKLIRNNILKINNYVLGKPIELLKRELEIKGEISKLASNENSLGPSPIAIDAIKKSLGDGNFYPDNNCYNLRAKLAEYLGVSPNNLGIGNGTTELIFL